MDFPLEVKDALIGSCTNSSYEDLDRAASVARQAAAAGLEVKTPLLISPGSEQIRATTQRDGQLRFFEEIGATVLANACGPCIGQWQREDIEEGEKNTIITSFNRNFPARNDSNPQTLAFIGSPELIVATAFAGKMGFDPRTDSISHDGKEFRFQPPNGDELPANGFDEGESGFIAPPDDGSNVEVIVAAGSDRLQRLTPFPAWDGADLREAAVLLKAQGKTTTDHVSPAGPWLKFRGHLDNISNNMYTGAENAFTDKTGTAINTLDDAEGQVAGIPDVARAYKAAEIPWVVIGDENYGEGSSREHAAMEPRHLGGRAIIVRSFARIAETNLKKQGLLALTFDDPADYTKFGPQDRVAILGLEDMAPERSLQVEITHPDGSKESITVNHSFTAEQIEWAKAGSALNMIAAAEKNSPA